MIKDFFVPFAAVGLAELGDKTQLAVFLLASRTKRHVELLAGVLLGFLLVDSFAVVIGSWAAQSLPLRPLKFAAGAVFMAMGLWMLRSAKDGKEEGNPEVRIPFLSGFMAVALTEWGDKTQIAAGLFATKYNPSLVLAGTLAALAVLSLAAVYLGQWVAGKMNQRVISITGGAMFFLMGVSLLFL